MARPTAIILRLKSRADEHRSATFLCLNCHLGVDSSDSYCRHCGARLLGVKT